MVPFAGWKARAGGAVSVSVLPAAVSAHNGISLKRTTFKRRYNNIDRRGFATPDLRCCAAPDDSDGYDASLKNIAQNLVRQFVKSGMVVGIDSGEVCTLVLQEIARQLEDGQLKGVQAIAACDAAASEAAFVGVPQAFSADHDEVDVMFAEVDEVDVAHTRLPFVFGRKTEPAQPQITRYKAAANKAKKFVAIVSTEDQAVARLTGTLPVVVDSSTWEETAEGIDDIFLGDAEVWRRPSTGTANPQGGDNPYVSQEGYNILDVKFYDEWTMFDDADVAYEKMEMEIMTVEGVVAIAYMENVADTIVICGEGETKLITKEELLKGMDDLSPSS